MRRVRARRGRRGPRSRRESTSMPWGGRTTGSRTERAGSNRSSDSGARPPGSPSCSSDRSRRPLSGQLIAPRRSTPRRSARCRRLRLHPRRLGIHRDRMCRRGHRAVRGRVDLRDTLASKDREGPSFPQGRRPRKDLGRGDRAGLRGIGRRAPARTPRRPARARPDRTSPATRATSCGFTSCRGRGNWRDRRSGRTRETPARKLRPPSPNRIGSRSPRYFSRWSSRLSTSVSWPSPPGLPSLPRV